MNLCRLMGVCLAIAAGAPSVAAQQDEPAPEWGEGDHRSFVAPALEIVAFEFLLNLYDRNYQDDDAYKSDFDSFKANLSRGWIIDDDPFAMNQFLHPYSGSLNHGFARSCGLTYWEALPYDLGGSLLWELAGETEAPSINDVVATTIGGGFLGEALFRISSLILEQGGRHPGFGRELAAGLVSPPMGINRLAFDRFDGVFKGREPATFTRAGFGGTRQAHLRDVEAVAEVTHDAAFFDVAFAYGMPGDPDYEYRHPFDYFQIEASATSGNGTLPENVLIRGLLWGSDYEGGESCRGIWGLYGVYEYMSPEIFSVSSTALAVGTTLQYRMSKVIAAQATALAGLGYTAVGTIADASEDRDFHYGYSPQGLLALRFVFDDVALLDFGVREYYVGSIGSLDGRGRENVLRAQAELLVRVVGHHALGIRFVSTARNSDFFDVENGLEAVGAVSIFYAFVGDPELGVVKEPE